MARIARRGALPTLADLRPETLRGRAGFFRLGRTHEGAWWLLTPEDEPVLLRAVAGVNRHGRAGPPPTLRGDYARTVEKLYGPGAGTGQDWARTTAARLHAWAVDTVGAWADVELVERGFYFTALADFCRAGAPLLLGPGLRLPDVFDPRWPAAAEAHAAAVVAPWAGRRELVGWFTDDALGWGATEPGRPGLFQACLSVEPSLAAHHAAWEFALAANGGSLEALGRRWGLELVHRERVRQLTREERGLSGAAFAEDAARFARELARRYFGVSSAALRAADPSHLVLGCRFATPPPAAVRAGCAAPEVDLVSWRLRAGESFPAQAASAAGAEPQWVTGGGLSHGDFKTLPVRDGTGPTRLERLLRAGREGLVAACRDPRTVGIEWAHWADGGHEAPPFGAGLVHADDHEAVEHTELLTHIHLRARTLHARGA
jgi:agarase